MTPKDFGYAPDKPGEVYEYEGHYFVQVGNTAWDVGRVEDFKGRTEKT